MLGGRCTVAPTHPPHCMKPWNFVFQYICIQLPFPHLCLIIILRITILIFQNTRLLSQFVSSQTGMILPRTYTSKLVVPGFSVLYVDFGMCSNYLLCHVCLYVCMYVYIYVCIYISMYVCMYVYTYMYVFNYVCMYTCMYVTMYACTYLCIYACIIAYMQYVCMYVCVYVCVYVHNYIYVLYVYVCVHVFSALKQLLKMSSRNFWTKQYLTVKLQILFL